MRRNEPGFNLVELVLGMFVLVVLLLLTAPPLLRATADLRLRLAAEELVSALRSARWQAIRQGANVAVRFRPALDGGATYAIYKDGDGDGVLNRDIAGGVDTAVMPPRRLEQMGNSLRFGFPPDRKVRDPGSPRRFMDRSGDPIRFNRSNLASFGPLGTSTPGSVYLTDGRERLAAVRVFGRTGKVKVIVYDFEAEVWK